MCVMYKNLRKMKVLALIVCVCYLSVAHGITEEEKQKLKTIYDECQANPDTHLDREVIKKLAKGEEADIHKLGAHSLCMAKKLHIIKENGDVDKEVLKRIIAKGVTDETVVNKTVEDCGVKQVTEEQTALKIMKCFHDHVGHKVYGHQGDHDSHH